MDRPVSPDILLSACEESHCLANGLFRLLDSQLPPQLRQIFEQLCTEAITNANTEQQQQQIPPLNKQQNGCSDLMVGQQQQQQRRPLPQPLMEVSLNGKSFK